MKNFIVLFVFALLAGCAGRTLVHDPKSNECFCVDVDGETLVTDCDQPDCSAEGEGQVGEGEGEGVVVQPIEVQFVTAFHGWEQPFPITTDSGDVILGSYGLKNPNPTGMPVHVEKLPIQLMVSADPTFGYQPGTDGGVKATDFIKSCRLVSYPIAESSVASDDFIDADGTVEFKDFWLAGGSDFFAGFDVHCTFAGLAPIGTENGFAIELKGEDIVADLDDGTSVGSVVLSDNDPSLVAAILQGDVGEGEGETCPDATIYETHNAFQLEVDVVGFPAYVADSDQQVFLSQSQDAQLRFHMKAHCHPLQLAGVSFGLIPQETSTFTVNNLPTQTRPNGGDPLEVGDLRVNAIEQETIPGVSVVDAPGAQVFWMYDALAHDIQKDATVLVTFTLDTRTIPSGETFDLIVDQIFWIDVASEQTVVDQNFDLATTVTVN